MAIAILKALGHERIILAEIDEKKWALAREAGATMLINPQRNGAIEQLKNVTGSLWGAIDFVGATQTAEVALQSLRKGGRLISVGLFGGEIKLPTVTLAQRALTIQGSYVGSLPELREVVELAKTGRLQPLPLSTCSVDEISGVLDQLKLGQVHGRVVARLD
jgi:D-arabinose 1-dehydrogenase-like Zn-dependent alcohol dehydrogenase